MPAQQITSQGIRQKLATKAETENLFFGGKSLPEILLFRDQPWVFLLLIGTHRTSQTDQKVKRIQGRQGLSEADHAGADGMTPLGRPLQKGARTIKRVMLEAEDAHGRAGKVTFL